MDVFQTVSGYITKMVSAGDGQAGSGAAKMKILLLDNETVCNVITRTQCAGPDHLLGAYSLICDHSIRPSQP